MEECGGWQGGVGDRRRISCLKYPFFEEASCFFKLLQLIQFTRIETKRGT